MSQATPRILPKHLHAFSPSAHPSTSTVRLLGTVTSLRGETATIESGGSNVTLLLNRDSHLQMDRVVEIVGKVIDLPGGQGLGIRVMASTEWGDKSEIDFKAFEAVVDATHRWKEIFYEGGEDVNGL